MKRFDSNKQKEKVYSSLVLVGIISSIMLFAGFSSAVLVTKMDKFWVNIHLPNEFIISTILIIISSVFLIFALKFAKKGLMKGLKTSVLFALIFGLGFGYFQIKGWYSYYNRGNALKSYITYVYGRYGEEYKVCHNKFPIEYDGENYQLRNKNISKELLDSVKLFVKEIANKSNYNNGSKLKIKNYSNPFTIYNVSKEEFLKVDENDFLYINGEPLTESAKEELFKFAFGLFNDQPFFMLKGKYGEDFSITLNGEELTFEKKKLYFPQKKLNPEEKLAIDYVYFDPTLKQEYILENGKVFLNGKEFNDSIKIELNDGIVLNIDNGVWTRQKEELNPSQYGLFFSTANVSSSFVWILTIIHFIHLLFSLVGLTVVYNRSKKGFYGEENVAGLKAMIIFWHFVGLLWLYLYIFLEYIN